MPGTCARAAVYAKGSWRDANVLSADDAKQRQQARSKKDA